MFLFVLKKMLLNYIQLFSEDPQFRPTDPALKQLEEILRLRLGSGEEN
jgi:hypothetical protein